jgi:hypothetical protein
MSDEAMAGSTAPDVRADHVEISQTGAQNVDAQTVSINQGGAAQVRAQEVTVSQGGIALARAEHVDLREGSSAFAMVADEANVEAGATVLLLVAGETSGEVRPLLTPATALAIGAGFGLAVRLLRRLI